ncbi:major facilitator superfamily domain-containing protein [Scenedesmus sp. NREL 46B-D3]|nr:major facilitator superfamily domain-containing protein [Scenedesmus sp. NREL 46B-D3]
MATSVAVSQTMAAPIAAALLRMDGLLGLSGWQWVFIGEGLPSVLLGMCLPRLLPDGPHAADGTVASWLAPHEVQLLQADHAAKVSSLARPASLELLCTHELKGGAPQPAAGLPHKLQLLVQVLRVWQVWYLACCNILKDIANLGLMMWLPVMVQSLLSGADPVQLAGSSSSSEGSTSPSSTGVTAVLLSAIPFTSAAIAVTYFGHHAQRTGKPPLWYVVMFSWVGGLSLISFHWIVKWSRVLGFCCLIITLSCAFAASPHPPTVVAKLTLGPAAALALPLYNSVAMMGGFFGPALMGWCVQHLGGFGAATAFMGGCFVLSGLLVWLLQHIMLQDCHTRSIVGGRAVGAALGGCGHDSRSRTVGGLTNSLGSSGLKGAAGVAGSVDRYDVVHRRSSSSSSVLRKADSADAVVSELARLVHENQADDADGLCLRTIE